MLYDILIFTPLFVCLFWMVIYFKMARRTELFRSVFTVLFVSALYFLSDCAYDSPNTPSKMWVWSSILAQLTAPSVIPVVWIFLMHMRGQKSAKTVQMLCIVFPAMLTAAALLLTLLEGPDRILALLQDMYTGNIDLWKGPDVSKPLRAYYFLTSIGMRTILVFEAIVYGIAMIALARRDNLRLRHLWKYTRGEHVRVLELVFFIILQTAALFIPKMLLRHDWLMANPWLSAILSLLISTGIFGICHVTMFAARASISKREVANGFRYNYREENRGAITEQMIAEMVEGADDQTIAFLRDQLGVVAGSDGFFRPETPADLPGSVASEIFSAVAKSWNDDSLLSRFEQMMLHEQAFLEPGLTLSGVAERLHSNKTYVSRLVNNTYNMPFPDLINTLRVDYAEQFIVLHRDAKQQEVATACGFTSASSFNNVFKKITGMTPKIWLATWDRQSRANGAK